MTITSWLLIATAIVWAIGTPVVYGTEKRRTVKPEPLLYAFWVPWALVWLLGEIIGGIKFLALYLWQTLEAIGYAWAASDRRV